MIRLRELREERNWNRREAADFLGKPYTTYVNHENGFREPNSEDLITYAKAYGVSVDYLVGRTDSKARLDAPKLTDNFVTFQIIGEVAAHYGSFGNEDWTNGKIDIPESWLHGRSMSDYFVLRVSGDSMYPTYQDGDLVLVLKQSTMDHSGQKTKKSRHFWRLLMLKS